MKITEERFNSIKPVIESVPKYSRDLRVLYKALNISKTTGSLIRNCKSYEDYKDVLRHNKQKSLAKTKSEGAPHIDDLANPNHSVDAKLDKIISMLQLVVKDRQADEKARTITNYFKR